MFNTTKALSEFLEKNPDKSAKIGATYILASFGNYDYFFSLFQYTDITDVCKIVSTICYLVDSDVAITHNLSIDYETANLSSIHDFIVLYCSFIGKK